MGCMVYAVARSKDHLDDDYHPDLDGEFKPNMINSVVFLVGAVQQVTPTIARKQVDSSCAWFLGLTSSFGSVGVN